MNYFLIVYYLFSFIVLATDEALNQVFGKAKKIVGDVITTKKD